MTIAGNEIDVSELSAGDEQDYQNSLEQAINSYGYFGSSVIVTSFSLPPVSFAPLEDGIAAYLSNASESLQTAESELGNGRYNSCANRCYYACFQAAIAAIFREGIHASGDQWTHAFVQSQFTGQLINRQHRYPAPLRSSLTDLHLLPRRADYSTDLITQTEASRGLRRSREFVTAIRQEGRTRS